MKFRVLTLALFLLACGSNLIAQEKKQVEPADLVNLKQVSDPEISPDGLCGCDTHAGRTAPQCSHLDGSCRWQRGGADICL
jgi:hypothetical protein